MKPKLTEKLPDKIHLLLDVALNDLNKVRRSKRYDVDMNDWHSGPHNGLCTVCLAGAVMAKTLHADYTKDINPVMMGENCDKLYALDDLRCGNLWDSMVMLCIDPPEDFPTYMYIPEYAADPTGFLRAMRKMQALFRKHDL